MEIIEIYNIEYPALETLELIRHDKTQLIPSV